MPRTFALLLTLLSVVACDDGRTIPPPESPIDAGRADVGATDMPLGPPTLTAEGVFELPGCPKCTRVFVRRNFCDYQCIDCSSQCMQACTDALLNLECEDH